MSGRRAPRDLRASDADRDRVLALLADAAGDGRLTPDEHSERVGRACSARTLGELAALTADLAEPSAQPVRLDGGRAVLGLGGTARRGGRWVVPENLSATVMLGEVELDFTEAILQAPRVRLYATVLGGRLRLTVPDGLAVTVTGPVIVGRRRGGTRPPARPDAPLIDVRAAVVGGEVVVRTPPRPRRRLLRRRG